MFVDCVFTVESGDDNECDVTGMARVRAAHHGYISSDVSLPPLSAFKACPWVIEAHPGQQISLKLIRLPSATSQQYRTHDVRVYRGDGGAGGGGVTENCFNIAVVAEATQQKSLVSLLQAVNFSKNDYLLVCSKFSMVEVIL